MFKPAAILLFACCLALASAPVALAQGKSDERGNPGAGQNSGGGNDKGNQGNNGNGKGNQGNGNQGNGNGGGPPPWAGNEHGDEQAALEAKREGRAVPLEDILAGLGTETSDNVIDAELVTVQGFLLYALKVLSPDGVVSTRYFYAQSGRPVD